MLYRSQMNHRTQLIPDDQPSSSENSNSIGESLKYMSSFLFTINKRKEIQNINDKQTNEENDPEEMTR